MKTIKAHSRYTFNISQNLGECLNFKKGEFIFKENENSAFVYFIDDGEINILKQKWVLWSAKSKEFIGISSFFSEGSKYNFSAKTHKDCKVLKINNSDFRNMLIEDSSFSRKVMNILCDRIKLTNEKTKSLLKQTSKYRLIHEIIKKAKESSSKTIECSLEELSEIIGVSKRLIRNTLSELEKKKLLERMKNNLIIHDLKGLEIIAAQKH